MSRKTESEKKTILCAASKAYNFIGSFDNFGHLVPDQIVNWKSDGDSCSFEIKGLASLGLRITERTPNSKIIMVGEGKIPFAFSFNILIQELAAQECQVQIVIDSEMSPIMAMMAEKPLLNFADMVLTKLKVEMEK